MDNEKEFWQLVKFLLISCIASVVQFSLVNILYIAFKSWKTPLSGFLAVVFSESTMGSGNSNWGYVMTFFLSNLVANAVGYIINKKTVFKSDAPAWCFAVYMGVSICLILFATWLQGVIACRLLISSSKFLINMAPTIAAAIAAFMQTLVIFPLDKFVLLKPRKPQ